VNGQGREGDELAQAMEAADRAGAVVTEHLRSVIDAAQSRANEIEQSARQEAEQTRRQAHASAIRMLERVDAMENQLGELVSSLRREADQLAADLDQRG
jgi:hypothetical protein